MLPDPLLRLQSQYEQLIEQFQHGELSYDDALSVLANMVEIDGAGQQWSIDADGQFTVASPGGVPQPADPSYFAAAQLPPRSDVGDVPPWADPYVMGVAPEAAGPVGGPPWPGAEQQLAPVYPPGPGVQPIVEPTPLGRPKHLGEDPSDSPLARLRAGLGKFSSSPAVAGAAKRIPGDKRTLLLLVVAVLVVFGITSANRLGNDPLEDLDNPAFGEPTPPSEPVTQDSPGGELPTDAGEVPAPAPASDLPSAQDTERVIAALVSADRAAAAAVVVSPGERSNVALATGALAGLERAGIRIVAGEAKNDGGRVQQVWEMVDASDGEVFTSTSVSWLFDNGEWRLVEWPFGL
jgi:hypothetical protein